METHKFLNPQVGLHTINNIKLISYLTENNRHINYEDYPLNIFSLSYFKPHETHKHFECAKCTFFLQLQNGAHTYLKGLYKRRWN